MKTSKKNSALSRDLVSALFSRFGTVTAMLDALKPQNGYEAFRRAVAGDPVTKQYADYIRAAYKLYLLRDKQWSDLFITVSRIDGRSPPMDRLLSRATELLKSLGGSYRVTGSPGSLLTPPASLLSASASAPATSAKVSTVSRTARPSSRSRRSARNGKGRL